MSNKRIFLSDSDFKGQSTNEKPTIEDIFNFENVLENYLGKNKKVTALNSGTSAIHLALILAGVKENDEVLCQSFTYVATINPVLYQKAIPVFIDSEKETWNMCPVLLEEAIKDRIAKGKKPKAIIYVHLYGTPAKVDEIVGIAKKYNIILIEDAAEALGAEYKNEKCGTFGDYSILSFNRNKIVTTYGGGALVCNSKEAKEKSIFYATQAKEKTPHYEHKKLGYNYRINALAAKVGIVQFKFLKYNLERKKELHSNYFSYFKDISYLSLFKNTQKNTLSNYWLNTAIIEENKNTVTNQSIINTLAEVNIEARKLWKPMHLQEIFQKCVFYNNNVSTSFFKKGLCLPSGSNLSNNDFNRITSTIQKLL